MSDTVLALLDAADPSAPALGAPGRPDLSYADLRALIGESGAALNGFGLGRGDAVAIVAPNGPEMAAAFLAVACAATAAPLNPAYRPDEFEFYLADLEARAVVVQAGDDSPVREVAGRLGLPLVELEPRPDGPAGAFDLRCDIRAAAARPGPAAPDDVALVLHTSGTTSRPKIVPLSQGNVCASARHIGRTLALDRHDRCLNIMPLFHIHGLIGAVLAGLAAGGAVVCAPGFNALRFFAWLEAARPTWYTAVPTMHQAILARASRNAAALAGADLRFVRSSSASLPPSVMAELEETFGAPVIESYGMTEAAHQMTSNPLPPRPRKPGSVGLPAGPDVAVMDEAGALLPPGATGEIVIRGPNVTSGYARNPAANADAYRDGWFRTGDQGLFDDDGYLRITGRLKEIINRGGEKISPREIDEVLLAHPDVAQAVAFAVPHDSLGEEVAAAVVLRPGATAAPRDIRAHVSARVAPFKTPRTVLIVEEIPKGPTGKLQRIGLAAKLGLT
ncbi:MAG: acyl--CoA ligase [Chloroflexi bacterium]|nr:acyl--CoA ligase [Chloroflexota bacterium]